MPVDSGVVKQVQKSPKVFNTKFGEACNRGFTLDGNKWYTVKFDKPERPSVAVGQQVSFSYEVEEYNGRESFAVNKKTLEVSGVANGSGGGSNNSNAGGTSNASSAGLSRDDYWKNKEASDSTRQNCIVHQSSRNAAITIALAAIEQGVVKLPAKQGDKLDVLLELVDEITDRFNRQVVNIEKTGEILANTTVAEVACDSEEDAGPEDDIGF